MTFSEARLPGISLGTPVSFLPSSINGSANKIKSLSKCSLKFVKFSSRAVPSYHVAHNMLHVISALFVARDLHEIALRPLESTCWRQFAAH